MKLKRKKLPLKFKNKNNRSRKYNSVLFSKSLGLAWNDSICWLRIVWYHQESRTACGITLAAFKIAFSLSLLHRTNFYSLPSPHVKDLSGGVLNSCNSLTFFFKTANSCGGLITVSLVVWWGDLIFVFSYRLNFIARYKKKKNQVLFKKKKAANY